MHDEYDDHNWIDSLEKLPGEVSILVPVILCFTAIMIAIYVSKPDEIHYDCSQLPAEKLIAYMAQCKENYEDDTYNLADCEERYPELMCKPTVLNKEKETEKE